MSPTAAKRPCLAPGCPKLVVFGRCAEHTTQQNQERGSAASRGYDARHRRWRIMVLVRSPLCVGHDGQHEPECNGVSTVADHIVPLPRPNWWEGDWSLENGQGLSRACHNAKTRREQG